MRWDEEEDSTIYRFGESESFDTLEYNMRGNSTNGLWKDPSRNLEAL
jgi:hypothetical protein